MSDFDMLKKNNTQAGFSMLEVLAALVLSLLLIESLLPLMLAGTNGVGLAGQRTTAGTYADSLLEEMKARPELLNGLSVENTVRAADLPFSVPIPPGIEATISLKVLDEESELYQVRLKVLSTRGNRQWEENLIGLVPIPLVQE